MPGIPTRPRPEVRDRDEQHTEGVKEAEEYVGEHGDPGPQDPTAGSESDDEDGDGSDVPDGTTNEVLDWVGDDSERAQRALDVERTGQNRSGLISELEKRS